MKKYVWFCSVILLIIIGIFIFQHYKKTDYYFSTSTTQKINGEYKVIKTTNQFVKEIKKMKLNKNILHKDDYSVTINLTKKDLKRIINSKEMKKYFYSYTEKGKDLKISDNYSPLNSGVERDISANSF